MGKLTELLTGKKTYIVAFVMAVVTFVNAAGLAEIDMQDATGILGALGLATLRKGIG